MHYLLMILKKMLRNISIFRYLGVIRNGSKWKRTTPFQINCETREWNREGNSTGFRDVRKDHRGLEEGGQGLPGTAEGQKPRQAREGCAERPDDFVESMNCPARSCAVRERQTGSMRFLGECPLHLAP